MAKKTSCTNSNLHRAKNAKNDEFYTKLKDIENELQHYKHHFNGKVIFCNCDKYEQSNFYKYFKLNFNALNLKKLICVGYSPDKAAVAHVVEHAAEYDIPLKGNGDFRGNESIDFLKEADIVVTNPPFSLFREFVAQLVEYDKKFLILGNNNAISYKEIFPLIKEDKLWLGYSYNKTMEFKLHPDYDKWDRVDEQGNKYGKVPAISWFTNLDIAKRHTGNSISSMTYKHGMKRGLYQKFDNYDAINVDRVKDIPNDYEGVMGVPITYFDKHNPGQYEIIGLLASGYNKEQVGIPKLWDKREARGVVNGKVVYSRILIKKVAK